MEKKITFVDGSDFSSLYYFTEGYSSMSWETDDYNYTVFDSMLYNFRRKN